MASAMPFSPAFCSLKLKLIVYFNGVQQGPGLAAILIKYLSGLDIATTIMSLCLDPRGALPLMCNAGQSAEK